MKDLYRRLGIEPQSSDEEISSALASKPELSEFSSILLNPERRAQYDETHHILKTIGILRHHLGLDTGHSWFLDNCPDFTPRKGPAAGRGQAAQPQADAQRGEEKRAAPTRAAAPTAEARPGKALPLALGIIGLVAAALLIAWLML